MRFRPLLLAAGLAFSAGAASLCGGRAGTSPALASGDSSAPGPTLALLAGEPGGEHTSLYLVEVGRSSAAPAPVATFTHLAGAVVRGAVLPGTSTVVAVADTADTRDASFNGSLFRLAPHAPPERLVDRVVHASRPLATPAGRVFVSRGVAGPEEAGASRIDELSIDEVDLASGVARTVHTFSGSLLFLAGFAPSPAFGPGQGEVLVYRIGPSGADLCALDPDSGAPRTVLADLPPYARDFSIDSAAGRVVFEDRHPDSPTPWIIEAADLATGSRTRLAESASYAIAPHVWPTGGVAWSPGGKRGLEVLGGSTTIERPFGAGVDLVLATSTDGAWVAALHTVPSTLPVAFAIESRTGKVAAVAAPEGSRVTIAGFVPAAPAAQAATPGGAP